MEIMHLFIANNADSRANYYYGMSSVKPTAVISLIYVIGVTILGPVLMRYRKPFKLKKILIWYNAFQVVLSAYVCYKLYLQSLVLKKFSCDVGDTASIYAVGASWWYYVSKFAEFFDTIFFVLRKKYNQVSVLHVSHHAVMPLVAWVGVKFSPCGTPIIFGATNAFVHVIMYSYYLLSAMGPGYQKVLNKYKPYITIIQIVQFIYVMIHCFVTLATDCPLNKLPIILTLTVAISFLVMFSMFFKKAYKTKSQNNNNTK